MFLWFGMHHLAKHTMNDCHCWNCLHPYDCCQFCCVPFTKWSCINAFTFTCIISGNMWCSHKKKRKRFPCMQLSAIRALTLLIEKIDKRIQTMREAKQRYWLKDQKRKPRNGTVTMRTKTIRRKQEGNVHTVWTLGFFCSFGRKLKQIALWKISFETIPRQIWKKCSRWIFGVIQNVSYLPNLNGWWMSTLSMMVCSLSPGINCIASLDVLTFLGHFNNTKFNLLIPVQLKWDWKTFHMPKGKLF